MNNPLVTVVIPTFRRPEFLPRAVTSALEHMGHSVEVIVVPNGGDDTWNRSLASHAADERVRVMPVAEGNVCLARNHGLESARGKYVRFLDDDDYLLPDAVRQLELLESSGAEICSGRVDSVDQHGVSHGLASFPDTGDFVSAAATVGGFALPIGHLYLKSALGSSVWDSSVKRAEDFAWQLDLAARKDWKWIPLNNTVGVWFQHGQTRRGLRASVRKTMKGREEPIISRLLSLHASLGEAGRGSKSRDSAIASALWHYAHRGFPYRPFHWLGVARKAVRIDPASRPDAFAYQQGFLRHIPPILAECGLFPVRRVTRLYRDIRLVFRDIDYVRKI